VLFLGYFWHFWALFGILGFSGILDAILHSISVIEGLGLASTYLTSAG